MYGDLDDYLRHLKAVRNASPYTLRNYSNEIAEALDFFRSRGILRFDQVDRAAQRAYLAQLAERGLQVTELSTHLQGQLVAVHPAYDTAFDGFAAPQVRGKPEARTSWAIEQCKLAAKASRRQTSSV